jgi:alanine dehydrogenase
MYSASGLLPRPFPTTHSNPTYYVEGVLHYCVANMPGLPCRALQRSRSLMRRCRMRSGLANHGFLEAIANDTGLKAGVNTYAGRLTYEAVAVAQ